MRVMVLDYRNSRMRRWRWMLLVTWLLNINSRNIVLVLDIRSSTNAGISITPQKHSELRHCSSKAEVYQRYWWPISILIINFWAAISIKLINTFTTITLTWLSWYTVLRSCWKWSSRWRIIRPLRHLPSSTSTMIDSTTIKFELKMLRSYVLSMRCRGNCMSILCLKRQSITRSSKCLISSCNQIVRLSNAIPLTMVIKNL